MRVREIQPSGGNGSNGGRPPAREPQPGDVLEAVWRGRWIVLLTVVMCFAAGVLYLQAAQPLFTSSSRILIEQSGPKIIPTSDGALVPAGGNFLNTQCEVLKSPTIVAIAGESGAFREMKTFNGSDDFTGRIKSALDVEIGRNNDIITVSFTGPDASEAADVVNRIVGAYRTYQHRQKKSTATEVLNILQQEHDKLQHELDEKLRGKLEFLKNNPGLVITGDHASSATAHGLDGLAEAYNVARLATFRARADLEYARRASVDPDKLRKLIAAHAAEAQGDSLGRGSLLAEWASPEEQQLRGKLQELQDQFDALKSRYLSSHPLIRDFQARMDRLNSQIAQLHSDQGSAAEEKTPRRSAVSPALERYGQILLAAAEQKYEIAQLNEAELAKTFDASIESERRTADAVNSKAAMFEQLDKDYNRTLELANQLQGRINEIHVTQDTGAMNLTVLEWAKPSPSPSKPDRVRAAGVCLVLGLVLGLSLTLANSRLDQRLRSLDEIESMLELPILGAVPKMEGKGGPELRGRQVHLEPGSSAAESFRTIRTSIHFGVPDSKSRRAGILVTSPEDDDGKSTTAANIAITMAKSGKSTLLIDADFRRPVLHKVFNVDNRSGLSTLCAPASDAAEAIKQCDIESLHILPCGPIPPDPPQLLSTPAFADLMARLASQYDQIVIDSPPILPVSDARILGAVCEATVFVLRAEKSSRRSALHARQIMVSLGCNLIGVVLNAVPRRRGRSASRYGYYGGHRYRDEHRSATGPRNGDSHLSGHA